MRNRTRVTCMAIVTTAVVAVSAIGVAFGVGGQAPSLAGTGHSDWPDEAGIPKRGMGQASSKDSAEMDGPFTEVVSFATKTGFRAVVTFAADNPVSGIVHYGTDPDALDERAIAPGPSDTAQLVVIDGLEVGATYYFQIEDALSGKTSRVHELQAKNAFNDLDANREQDNKEASFKREVYTVNLLVQLDTQSLPDNIDPDRSIAEIAQAISVMAERVYDALDGHARIGEVLVTDTNIDHAGTVPGVAVVDFTAVCETPTNRADVMVTTAMPFDSHTFHYAIKDPCIPIFLGRQGWLVVPWQNDLDFGHVAAHEMMHYAFGAPDLYDLGGGEGCRNDAWDGSLMHNTGGWGGTRWAMTEVDENRALTPCPHATNYKPSTWGEIQSAYTTVPNRRQLEDVFNFLPRGNPDGGALEIHVLDREPGRSTLARFDPRDSNPEIAGRECAETSTSFTDKRDDASGALGVETVPALSDSNLDVVAGAVRFIEGGDAQTVDAADTLQLRITTADLTEMPAAGSHGEYFDFFFSVGGQEYDAVAEWNKVGGEPQFSLNVLGTTGRERVGTVEGAWDLDTDTITLSLPGAIPANPDNGLSFAMEPGATIDLYEVVSRRRVGGVVPDADTATGGCPIVLPGTPPPPPPPPPLPPADATLRPRGEFRFSSDPATATDAEGLGIGVTGAHSDTYLIDVTAPGTLKVEATADFPELNDIDLYVYDASGNEIASSTAPGGAEALSATVARGRYEIVVVRWATVEAAYSGTASL